MVKLLDPTSELYGKGLVEYVSGAAVETLEKDLPLDRPSDSYKDIVFHIETLASVYSSEKGLSQKPFCQTFAILQNSVENLLNICYMTS